MSLRLPNCQSVPGPFNRISALSAWTKASDRDQIILIVCGPAQLFRSRFAAVGGLRAAFGRRVRELRHQLGISQEELADRAGLHWTYVGGIERGERNPALINVGKLVRALQVPLAEFWSVFDDEPASRKKRPTGRSSSI